MASRTYNIRLIGESAHAEQALATLDTLLSGEALELLQRELAPHGLSVQRLASDGSEAALFVTPSATAGEEVPLTLLAASHGGGGTTSPEDPVT